MKDLIVVVAQHPFAFTLLIAGVTISACLILEELCELAKNLVVGSKMIADELRRMRKQ